ncbi:MAG TPA: hypothetical protein VEK57_26330 [Thermoanaerobaculia bacterium]|nr:hypothetical protein [Thermoanaerobaculia bacterium]
MSNVSVKVALAVLVATGFACGRAGTWEDDPRNFERAWGRKAPPGLVVKHSRYWRSTHFTREEAYYFQFGANRDLTDGFIDENSMQPMSDAGTRTLDDETCFDRPAWFAPRPLHEYEIWICPDDRACVLLRHRQTGDTFFGACQL